MPHHRRGTPRTAWRGLEVTTWVACVAVIVAVAVILGTSVDLPVRWKEAPRAAPTVDCAFTQCLGPPITGPPTRLRITSIGVDQSLEVLDLDPTGELRAPVSYDKPGWFGKGVLPGEAGAAVVAGHVDSTQGPAVFFDLHLLRPGDIVEVERGGHWVTFRVTGTERYPKDAFPSERVYGPTPDAELRLITCGGVFDRRALSYRDNIVVYAIIVRS